MLQEEETRGVAKTVVGVGVTLNRKTNGAATGVVVLPTPSTTNTDAATGHSSDPRHGPMKKATCCRLRMHPQGP